MDVVYARTGYAQACVESRDEDKLLSYARMAVRAARVRRLMDRYAVLIAQWAQDGTLKVHMGRTPDVHTLSMVATRGKAYRLTLDTLAMIERRLSEQARKDGLAENMLLDVRLDTLEHCQIALRRL